jgi:peptidyl-prolyl cis-trans isomerase A (cyclophilin A)
MKLFTPFFLSGLLLLSACGGSDGPGVTVTDIKVDRLSYGQLSQFKILGTGLDTNITVNTQKCRGLVVLPGGSATEQTVSCTPIATGTDVLRFEVTTREGNLLQAVQLSVPEPQVTLTTNLGVIVLELNPTLAPLTVNNYLQYVKDGFYTNTLFHRVIDGFVAQGGLLVATTPPNPAVTPKVQTGLRDPIALETNKGLSNLRGTVGMARGSAANTATAQFYFNLVDNTGLDFQSSASPGYAVFGKVVSGDDVMVKLGKTPVTTQYSLPNYPVTDVVVQTAVQTR